MDLNERLEQCRLAGDPMADAAVEAILQHRPDFWSEPAWTSFAKNIDQPDSGWPVELLQLIDETEKWPGWANEKAIRRAQDFFALHRPLVFLCLGLYSLPYCYAAANGARVLYHSRRLRDAPGKRLTETASFVLDVCEPGAFLPEGKARRSILKVRLMHSLVRHYLQQQPFWKSNWGVPVNQEDMAGTNLAFSLVVLRGLRKMGVDITSQQSADFLHTWKVIAFLLGVSPELLVENPKSALQLERAIKARQFSQSMEGMELVDSLRKYIEGQIGNQPAKLPVSGLMSSLLGSDLSQHLGIEVTQGQLLRARTFLNLTRLQNLLGVNFLWRNDQQERVSL